MRRRVILTIMLAFLFFTIPFEAHAQPGEFELTGRWYGVFWKVGEEWRTGIIRMDITESNGTGTAILYIPDYGIFDQSVTLTIVDNQITIGIPALFALTGTIFDDTIEGEGWQGLELLGTWYAEKEYEDPIVPGPAPGPECDDLPPMMCVGDAEYCSEIIPFEPVEGPGYVNYPYNGETWEDQKYSYLRRDHVYLIKYATAKVACKTANWDYGNLAPLYLGDMSEEDGSTPGTDVGDLLHPPGTHEDGKDIDTAYYQLYTPDNMLRAVGDHYSGTTNELHLVGEPWALDHWRTALFIAYLSEHPGLRIIGVDGQIGLILEPTLDELVVLGWIDEELRSSIPLAYEVTDQGMGWFYHHYGHMHISMRPEVVGIEDQHPMLTYDNLITAYPNPLNSGSTITLTLPHSQKVNLNIYDLKGRAVGQLLSDTILPAGVSRVLWHHGNDESGELTSGVFFLRLEAGSVHETHRIIFLH